MPPESGEEVSINLLRDYKHSTPHARSISSSSSSTLLPISLSSSSVILCDEKDHYGRSCEAYEEEDDGDFTAKRPSWPRRRTYHSPFRLIGTATGSLLLALLPSFLLRSNHGAPTKLHPTAYLDGLRGVAAFFVFIHHFILDWFPSLSAGYASTPEQHWLAQLPLVRIIYSGRGMVALFFVISGYVLSYKTLRQVRRYEHAAILETLTSSVFRRGIRLFLPITVSTFISMIITRLDWYQYDPQHANMIPMRQITFWEQFSDWLDDLFETTNPFREIDAKNLYGNSYDGHLWTIPIEFRGSIVVFLTLLCVAKAKQSIRLLVMTYLTLYAFYVTHWDLFLFLSGMLLCEIDWIRQDVASPPSLTNISTPKSRSRRSPILRFIYRNSHILNHIWTIPLFFFGIHLLCYPDLDAAVTPGYIYIAFALTPYQYEPFTDPGLTQRFWLSIGAVLLAISLSFSPLITLPSLPRIPFFFRRRRHSYTTPTQQPHQQNQPSSLLQYPFTTRTAQYLGKISFSLYMMHGPVLYTLGMKFLYRALPPRSFGFSPIGVTPVEASEQGSKIESTSIDLSLFSPGDDNWRLGEWFIAAVVVNTIVCIWAADVFWRAVDARSVRFAGRVRDWCWR